MKLAKKLQRSYTWIIVMIIIIAGISSTVLFQRSLNSFLNALREKEFDQISSEISEISQLHYGINPIYLENYVQDKAINLIYFNTKNQVVAQFNGIEKKEDENIKYIKKKYRLIDSNDEISGFLEISYAENVFEYDKSTKEFYTEMVKNSTILFLFAILIATIMTTAISKTITNPIVDIQKKAQQIRSKNYNLENKTYNIYELDELSSNIDYLSNTLSLQEQLRLDYAHDIAHELRTPITNLMLHLEGIRDEIVEADDATINLLISEVHRINTMIDNLETTFNNSEEITNLEYEDIDLGKLLENITSSFIIRMNEKNIELETKFSENSIIKTDKNKLTQIFSNIISNAIKAVDNGGKIQIIHNSYKNREVIRISDNGIGMKEEDMRHIFERFYRVDNVRNTKVSGHGLGLSITKTFVDLLGYNLSVDSTIGKGSEFILTIQK